MAKKVVICSDGTWNKREDGNEKNTNIARLYDVLKVNDKQIGFYDAGIGTGMYRYLGGATGLGISKNIKQCYEYLVNHYDEGKGDEIYLFGFSRGAYTVRSLAGFVYRCGVLRQEHSGLIDHCYSLYRDKNVAAMQEIKETKASGGNIRMMGVWDTVGALGIPVNWINQFNPFFHKFHDTKLNESIKFGYHVLAIDDDRKTFSPAMWDENAIAKNQTIEQVWFSGDHSDVGGGYTERGLPDITFDWMISKARKHGLEFTDGYLDSIKPDAHGYLHNPRSGIGKVYRKQLRKIPEDKKAWLFHTVATRIKLDNNRPEATYRPKNLRDFENLDERYAIEG